MALSDFWPKLQDEILDRKPGVNAEGVPQEQGMGHVRKFPAPLDLVLVPDPPSLGTRPSQSWYQTLPVSVPDPPVSVPDPPSFGTLRTRVKDQHYLLSALDTSLKCLYTWFTARFLPAWKYQKRSNTGGGEGMKTELQHYLCTVYKHTLFVFGDFECE